MENSPLDLVTTMGNEDVILDDLDSYLEDIYGRLTVSRMVSDSVIKGMVNAVREEAAESIASKESEASLLKEKLQLYESGAVNRSKELGFSSGGVERAGIVEECLGDLRVAAENQFQVIEKKIDDVIGFNLTERQNGRMESELVGVGESVNSLKNILKNVFVHVDNIVYLSKSSVSEREKEQEYRDEVEAMVFQSSIRGLLLDSEARFWEQRAQCSRQSTKIKELSSLLEELDVVSRTFACPEVGQLFSHDGVEDGSVAKRKVKLQRKISIPNSFKEANLKDEESKNTMTDTLEYAQIKHLQKDELISYFKTEMTKMKRNHESYVQELTEEYFSLRREFLKDRGPSSTLRKDKDFESLRKKIPEVIVKLEDILIENEKLPMLHENTEMVGSLKGRIDTLISENHQLKDLITSRSKEVRCLSSQVSSARDKMSLHSLAEANLLKQIMSLKCDIEETKVEVSVREDILKYFLRESIAEINSKVEDFDMEFKSMLEICEIIFKGFVHDGKMVIKSNIEDSDVESIIMHELSGIVFREAAKDALRTFNLFKKICEEENEQKLSLETSLVETRKALFSEIGEKEKLEKEMASSSVLMEEKEKLAQEMRSIMTEEKKRFDQTLQELNLLRDKANQQERVISENYRESNSLKAKLEEATVQIHLYEEEKDKLVQKLKFVMDDLKEANQERGVLQEIIRKKENGLSFSEAKDTEYRKQIEAIGMSLQRLCEATADFEHRTAETIEKNNKRLRLLKNRFGPLIRKATLFRKMKSAYKQRLDKRYSDLQKAEAEVDLLGDEVDALLSLLEKIYIALDHYSPILQHYPGMMEILKLIKRELSGETAKSV